MDIYEVIKNEEVISKYQPIMSTHNKDFLGIEALVRGKGIEGEISPYKLFKEATKYGVVLDLDKLCIKKSIEGFEAFFQLYPRTLLFINIDATVLDYYISSSYIEGLLMKHRIAANNIVLEINELHSSCMEKMKEFSVKYKAMGCLIALDDIGSGESNLDRIPLIMPDIMKIDKELVRGLNQSFFSQQVVGRIIQMATNLGAQIVIEGIEEIEDVNRIAEYGSHLIQGYFLGKPMNLDNEIHKRTMKRKKMIIHMMHTYIREKNNKRKIIQDYMCSIFNQLKKNLEDLEIDYYKASIFNQISKYTEIESVYILNSEGRLITDTIFNGHDDLFTKNLLYSPCVFGDSVELEEYYIKIIFGGFSFWISNEYISMATGNKCYTYSGSFWVGRKQYIICIDFDSCKMNNRLNKLSEIISS